MPGKSAATYELLFDNSGPLATMSSKVRLAHALSWLTDQTSADLHILRKIRNRFAHDPYKQAITDPEIVSLVESLSPREDYCKSALVAHGEKIVDLTPRIKFHTRAALISFAAAIELVAAPIVVVHGVPMCAVMHDYDNSPETKRQIAWSMTRVTFSLLTGKTDWE